MDTKEHILTSAQRLVQQRGFNGFSYADIAQEVGIRKASLHHHFASKTDLGLALIDSYTAQFGQELLRISETESTALDKLKAYAALYRATLAAERICLCGMLSSEARTLDATLLPKLKQFFLQHAEWLSAVLVSGKSSGVLFYEGSAADHARVILATLQGALMISRSSQDTAAFDQTVSLLVKDFLRTG